MISCKYCNRPCRKAKTDQFSISYLPSFQCDYHGSTTVKFIQEPSPTDWYITFLIFYYKEQRYQAVFYYNDPPYFNHKFQVEKIQIKRPSGNIIQEPVFTLDFHPDFTPENIQHKISSFMIFS